MKYKRKSFEYINSLFNEDFFRKKKIIHLSLYVNILLQSYGEFLLWEIVGENLIFILSSLS